MCHDNIGPFCLQNIYSSGYTWLLPACPKKFPPVASHPGLFGWPVSVCELLHLLCGRDGSEGSTRWISPTGKTISRS
ncbi:hypothetical protein OESDEN_08179 [Oesophagostomum dentatum]|uniref:Uncharacterized protein n=1 Tax=Oesophagostomum dentatum TaxID=61180 RepID=A0A0B1T710_OESDE|nr:hypothetical protein OESDEN_08179 [Oesophagostomum dentatum]